MTLPVDPNTDNINPLEYSRSDAILIIMDLMGLGESEANFYYDIISGKTTGDLSSDLLEGNQPTDKGKLESYTSGYPNKNKDDKKE